MHGGSGRGGRAQCAGPGLPSATKTGRRGPRRPGATSRHHPPARGQAGARGQSCNGASIAPPGPGLAPQGLDMARHAKPAWDATPERVPAGVFRRSPASSALPVGAAECTRRKAARRLPFPDRLAPLPISSCGGRCPVVIGAGRRVPSSRDRPIRRLMDDLLLVGGQLHRRLALFVARPDAASGRPAHFLHVLSDRINQRRGRSHGFCRRPDVALPPTRWGRGPLVAPFRQGH